MNFVVPSDKKNMLESALGLEEKSALELFYEEPCERTLRKISKRDQTPDIVRLAIENDGTAIKSVSMKLITDNLCGIAVSQNGLALRYISEKHLKYLNQKLCKIAVENNGRAIKYVPTKYIDKEMIAAAIFSEPLSIEYIPQSKRTKKLCMSAFEANPFVLRWIPEKHITREMCLTLIDALSEEDTSYLSWFPDVFRNDVTIIDALIKKIDANRILIWNQKLIEKIKESGKASITISPLSKNIVNYLQSIVDSADVSPIPLLELDITETPLPSSGAILVNLKDNGIHIYDLTTTEDKDAITVYYITDLHLEHQLREILCDGKADLEKVESFIDLKIEEMLTDIHGTKNYLLIGGDVRHTKELVSFFYRKLRSAWKGTVISILGNHELWDDYPKGAKNGCVSRPLEEIIEDYHNRINFNDRRYQSSVLLQNEVFINYKNSRNRVISEKQILSATDDDLRGLLSKATFIVLGGIGFSGLNQHFNAESGLYRSALTTIEEDRALSNQFRQVYDKINRCAGDMQVIVLTHTPINDWINEPVNHNWIYINGHTHRNALIREQDGTTILSDNQIGYNPSKWKLNAFTISGWYDPFRDMEDGIHRITSEQYNEFNRGRGIYSEGCNHPGTIYALKRDRIYMFVLQSASSLCMLVGGQRKKLNHFDIKYYYNNMERYAQNVKIAVTPYQNVLNQISNEIKAIGGWGTVHGCIVDIDYFNHIYLNPFDGKITAYYADDTSSRLAYKDLPSLLESQIPKLNNRFKSAKNNGEIPLLSQYSVIYKEKPENMTLVVVPKLVLGTEMYKPSRIMKSIQYIFDNNVIRIWNDDILTNDFETTSLSIEDKKNK